MLGGFLGGDLEIEKREAIGTTIPGTKETTQKSASCHPLHAEVNLEDSDSDGDERGRLLTWEMGL